MEQNETKELLDIYNKEDIMKMFKCESDKALRFLKLMLQLGEAIKIGREYYIYKDNLIKVLHEFEGKELII